ncbi:MAG: hypothetical protein RLZ98_2827 [Pseudomonadota bacterium]|jgi:HCOMODA/2-hydroxy-3-carboxy-muconic semialdehyde decarboxylase
MSEATSTPTVASVAAPIADTVQPAAPPDPEIVADMVVGNRILFREGVVDGFGHLSARHDKDPAHFLLARNMAPGLVTPDDIVEFDLDGNPANAKGRPVYLERFIHGEIYRARPDVMAIVHSHSPSVVPFSIAKGANFCAVCHMSGFIGTSTPVFEIRDVAGDASSLLITSNELGRALAGSLGDRLLVLMRGHGSTVVAGSVKQAVYRAVYTEVNARLMMDALKIGTGIVPLTDGEAKTTLEIVETQIPRAWGLWKMRAEGDI